MQFDRIRFYAMDFQDEHVFVRPLYTTTTRNENVSTVNCIHVIGLIQLHRYDPNVSCGMLEYEFMHMLWQRQHIRADPSD